MSTIAVGSVIDQIERKISDESNDDLAEDELITIFNNTIRTIISLVPKTGSVTKVFKMAPGPLQVLAANALELVDISLNYGNDGATPGTAIRETTIGIMETLYPTWAQDQMKGAGEEIEHYMKDDNDERRFYIWPGAPVDDELYALVAFSELPTPVTWDEDGNWRLQMIPIEDIHIDAIFNGMLYQYYDDDSDIPGNTPRSQTYYQRFLQSLQLEGTKPRQQQR